MTSSSGVNLIVRFHTYPKLNVRFYTDPNYFYCNVFLVYLNFDTLCIVNKETEQVGLHLLEQQIKLVH